MELTIKSETDAYKILEQISAGSGGEFNAEHFQINFDGWPKLELRVVGDGFNGTITPTIMVGLIEFQKAIYRSYAQAKYKTFNTNKLTKEEKQELEITVKVELGSSKFGIDLQKIAEIFAENLVGKMTGKEILVCILGLGVLLTGESAISNYLDTRKQIRQSELKSEEQIATIEALKFVSAEDTKKAQIISDLAENYASVANIKANAYNAHTEMFKSVRTADEAEVGGVEVDGETATELVKNARKYSNDVRLDGRFRVLVVDSQDPTQFKVKLRQIDNNLEFSAIVQDQTLTRKHQEVIQAAEWSRSVVELQINAKEVDGDIRQAIVISAKEVENK